MTAPLPNVDLDSTTDCPEDDRCEQCGEDVAGELGVVSLSTPVGVLCATLCDVCVAQKLLPRYGWAEAVLRSGQHCGHLGIDVDQMAALIDAEKVNDLDPYAAGDGHPLFGGPL